MVVHSPPMPYEVGRRDNDWCVFVQQSDGTQGDPVPGGCHPTEEEARRHMAALYKNVPEAATVAAPCSCQTANATSNVQVSWTAAATGPLDEPFPVPAYPPTEWFTERPAWLAAGMDIAVDDSGRVAGYFFQHGQCLIHEHGACPKPSPTGYAAFHQQHVVTADGTDLRVGVIGNVGGHASEYARVDVAQAHYANPNCQLVVCRAYDDDHGGYILGALVPGATYGDAALVRRCSLSGDWRPMPPEWWVSNGIQASVARAHDFYDCIGPTLVTRPGLPMIRQYAAAVLGGLGGIQLDNEELAMTEATNPPVVVHQHFAPGPQPAMTAASPVAAPPPDAPPPAEDTGGDVETRVAALEEQVATLQEAVAGMQQILSDQMDMQMAAIEASAPALPEPAA